MSHSVVIIGLGNIGYRIDRNEPQLLAQSHYRAFASSREYEVKLGLDSDESMRHDFESETGIPALKKAPSRFKADVVVLATSAYGRSSLLNDVIGSMSPSVILCEKPLAQTLDDLSALEELLHRFDTPVFLNYFRRALPEFQRLRSSLKDGRYGSVIKCNVWYSKGILNSASHFIDLIAWLVGSERASTIISDLTLLDLSGDFSVVIGGVPCYFLVCDERNFFLNTVEILTESARLRLDASGRRIEISRATARDANGLSQLDYESGIEAVNFGMAQSWVLHELHKFLVLGSCELSAAREQIAITKELIGLQDLITQRFEEK